MTGILSEHRVNHRSHHWDPRFGPHLYDLNAVQTGISITDQMRRGYTAAIEAFEAGYIDAHKPLLVVGAGVAGVMAAMTAVERGVTARIIEKERRKIFSPQFNCPSRFVCPTQYDWPADHWRRGNYPFDDEPMPFTWHRGKAAVVASTLKREDVDVFIDAYNPLIKIIESEFKGYELFWVSGTLQIVPDLDPPAADPDFPQAFSMALACAGFGSELTAVEPAEFCSSVPDSDRLNNLRKLQSSYVGHQFWSEDRYEEKTMLATADPVKPNVLISGGGDGALQDFLRIMVRPDSNRDGTSAGLLYEQVARAFDRPLRRRLETDLATARVTFQRSLVDPMIRQMDRTTRRSHICSLNRTLEAAHLELIKQLREQARTWRRLSELFDQLLKDLGTEIGLKLIHPCSHLVPYYDLNRFLVLLLNEYVCDKYPQAQLLQPQTRITNIVPASAGHVCGRPAECLGKDHEVYFTAADCITVHEPCVKSETMVDGAPYNVVVIRHGIEPNSRPVLL